MFLGIDLGTSGLKAAVISPDGDVTAETEITYSVDHPRPRHAEMDPLVWDAAVQETLTRFEAHRLRAIGIAGQMHGVVLVDAGGRPCRPAILWPDRRAESVLPRWRALSVAQRERLANPLVPGMAGPILDWLGAHEPEALTAAAAAVQPKDYVRQGLGGPLVSERSDASATLLWDLLADDWDLDVVDALGIRPGLLPPVVPSAEVVAETTLPGTPALVAGAGDTPAALLGSGGLAPGEVQVNLGSGVQILLGVGAPKSHTDPLTHLYADADGGWYAMCAIRNGGLALDRVRDWLRMSWSEFYSAAAASRAGAGGVSMLPFLSGERGAVAPQDARGSWLGLTDSTSRADIARAALEGVVFTIRRGLDLLDTTCDDLRMTGGGARNAGMAQLVADALGATVRVLPERSASAFGAAMLAAAGTGVRLTVDTGEPQVYTPRDTTALDEAFVLWSARLAAGVL